MDLCSHVAGSPEENSRKKARRVGRRILQRIIFRGGSWKDRLVKIKKADGGGGRVGRKSLAGFTLEGKKTWKQSINGHERKRGGKEEGIEGASVSQMRASV